MKIMYLILLLAINLQGEIVSISEPPLDTTYGKEHQGIKTGLWTQKTSYVKHELINVWILARKTSDSMNSFGVGGNLYKNSFVYIYVKDKEFSKKPIGAPFGGMANPSSFKGGISSQLADLPVGQYKLIWKTDLSESNPIEITIN
jgi:hypothetical protein